MTQLHTVGKSHPRREGYEKVTGAVEFTDNIELPGMLHGMLLRSIVPHGRIRHIDTARAKAVPGVFAVLTGEDILRMGIDPFAGPAFKDQAPLAIGKARFAGDPIAAVAAVDRDTAAEALNLIDVDIEELPAVFDAVEAMRPDAPRVAERLVPAGAFTDLRELLGTEAAEAASNIVFHYKLRRGDLDEGFRQSQRIFEHTFRNPPTQHADMEYHCSIARWGGPDRLEIWSATQSPSYVRIMLAGMFGLPESRVRVRVPYLGGAFGSKLYMKLEPIAALLARASGRPVKVRLTRREEFATITKHGVTVTLRTGVAADGSILARDCRVVWDTGAYADIGPRVTHKSGYTAAGPYKIPNVRIDSYSVLTNKPPAGAFRGFGIMQVCWAYESQMDIIARELDIDPLAYRLRHVLHEGDVQATGTTVHSLGLDQCLRSVAQAVDWGKGPHAERPSRGEEDQAHTEPQSRGGGQGQGSVGAARYGRPGVRVAPAVHATTESSVLSSQSSWALGKGVACSMKAVITPSVSGATVLMHADGTISVQSSAVDMGQGSDTLLSQIAAEELGVPVEHITMVHPDTDVTPYDLITAGSRTTFHMGNAVRLAAIDLRGQLRTIAAEVLNADPEEIEAENGRVWAASGPSRTVTYAQLMAARFGGHIGTLAGHGTFETEHIEGDHETGQSPNITAHWMCGATAAVVAVDRETGRVRLLRLATAVDAGKAINPDVCLAQISGASIQGSGPALFEEMIIEDGQLRNASFVDYRIPSFADIAESVMPILVEDPHRDGPYGAKGMGEAGIFAIAPAIANAIADAVGARVLSLPLTPEAVLRAMREGVSHGGPEPQRRD